METTRFKIQDRAELEETQHKWEGKDWKSIPPMVGSGYKVKHYRQKLHQKKR